MPMDLALLWLQLGATAAVILIASQFLARSADTVAEKTGLGRSFIGLVMLATATSLPEMGTGISAIAIGEPDLAAGDAFGSNLFNLMIIGLADLYWRNGPVLTTVRFTSIVVAALGAGLIALAIGTIYVHNATDAMSTWYVSPVSVLMIVAFLGAMLLVYRHEKGAGPSGEQGAGASGEVEGETHARYADQSLPKAFAIYFGAAAVVVAAAVWLAMTGDDLADAMGWEASFMGTQFLAISTSLPEIATSFAALRLNAPDLAITNVLGSNLFNMGFVLFVDDLVYSQGVVWSNVSQVHILTGLIAILMTAVVIVGVLTRPRAKLGGAWTLEGAVLVAAYLGASVLIFALA